MKRWIAHIDLDAFFVSVEEVLNPSLKGKPVIVGGDPSVGRGVVAAASYEARRFGIHSAMPVTKAKRLCPHAIFVRGNHRYYARASEAVFRIVETYTPFIEVVSIDEAYIGLTGFEMLFGHPLKALEQMKREIREKLHLTISAGLSSNRLLAKVASAEAKPDGIICVFHGYEEAFLAPLPVEKLPGVGGKMSKKLHMLGIRKIRDIVAIGEDLMKAVFGEVGASLYRRARGGGGGQIDMKDSMPKSVGHETTLDEDSNDVDLLENILSFLSEKVGRRLRKKGLMGSTVTLKLRYSDFATITRSQTISDPTSFDSIIFRTVQALFRKAYTRRTSVRLLGVSVSNLTHDRLQFDLFTGAWQLKMKRLYTGVDRVREKYGFDSVSGGRSSLLRFSHH